MTPIKIDSMWARRAFLLTSEQLTENLDANRFFSTGELKFTDTLPGGNFAINPPPQFTSSADIRLGSRRVVLNNGLDSGFSNSAPNPYRMSIETRPNGFGRMYEEAIDRNNQIIYLRFGVPMFTPMTRFFSNFYDSSTSYMATHGRGRGIAYWVGRAVGYILPLYSWQLMMVSLLGLAGSLFTSSPSTRYMTIKPTMPLWIHAWSTMVNNIAVYRGIIPRVGNSFTEKFNQNAQIKKLINNQFEIENLHRLLPGVFTKGGAFDGYSMMSRATRLQNAEYKRRQQLLEGAPTGFILPGYSSPDVNGPTVQEFIDDLYVGSNRELNMLKMEESPDIIYELSRPIQKGGDDGTPVTMEEDPRSVMGRYLNSSLGRIKDVTNDGALDNETVPADASAIDYGDGGDVGNGINVYDLGNDNGTIEFGYTSGYDPQNPTALSQTDSSLDSGFFSDFGTYFKSELNDGSMFLGLCVEPTGSVNISASNSFQPNPIAERINSTSIAARTTTFSISGGNISDNIIVKGIQSAVGAVKDALQGVLDSLHIGGVGVMFGGGQVEVSNMWQKSDYTPNSPSYTIEAIPVYNNPLGRLLDEDLVVCAVLCSTLPLSTGRHSHTAPFHCIVYDKSRSITRVAMFRSMTIERGICAVPFDDNMQPIGSRITFQIEDLEPTFGIPISQGWTSGVKGAIVDGLNYASKSFGGSLGSFDAMINSMKGVFSSESPYLDLITILAGTDIQDQIYWSRKFFLELSMQKAQWELMTSRARMASLSRDTWIGEIASVFFPGTQRK